MEGYLVLALHDPRYLDLAANFALSAHRVDRRPISVVTSPNVPLPAPYEPLFDQVIREDDHPPLKGAALRRHTLCADYVYPV